MAVRPDLIESPSAARLQYLPSVLVNLSIVFERVIWIVLDSVGVGEMPDAAAYGDAGSDTIGNIARAESLIRRLRDLGCGIALDDFGTGLSSLAYLRQLPVTMLKIDGSFVRDILKDPRAESMVRAIAQLARSMSLSTVAEYVETEEIRTRVATLGVDYGQGFAIGRPAPFADLLSELPLLVSADTMPTVISEFALDQLTEIVH